MGNLENLAVFALAPSEALGRAVAEDYGLVIAPHELRQFEDGEHKIRPLLSVRGRDVYILCSDGLSGMVVDTQICQIAANAKSLERAVAELVDAANRNGGTDNVTTLLLQCLAA